MSAHRASDRDTTDRVLRHAILRFVGLGVCELLLALVTRSAALTTSGIHNLMEYQSLGMAREARQSTNHTESSFWDCHVAPLTPIINAGIQFSLALGFMLLDLFKVLELRADLIIWALAIELVDLPTNLYYGLKLRGLHHHGLTVHEHHDHDRQGHAAETHLLGDAGNSAWAIAGFIALLFAPGRWWIDPTVALLGLATIVGFNWDSMVQSWRWWRQHQKEGHGPQTMPESPV